MSKTLIAVNTLTAISSQVYASHLNLMYRMGKDSGDEFVLYNAYRMSIDRFRNQAAKYALQGEFDYLMFLDDDVLVPRDTYDLLKLADVDIVTPLVYIRCYPFKPMMFKTIKLGDEMGLTTYDDWEEVVEQQMKIGAGNPHLLPCAAIGFSCALIKTSLIKRISPAWFVTGTNHTEDVYFCVKARQLLNNDVQIYVDTRIHAGHLMDAELIAFETKKDLSTYYESCNPEFAARELGEKNCDRGQEYLDKNIKIVQAAPISEGSYEQAKA